MSKGPESAVFVPECAFFRAYDLEVSRFFRNFAVSMIKPQKPTPSTQKPTTSTQKPTPNPSRGEGGLISLEAQLKLWRHALSHAEHASLISGA